MFFLLIAQDMSQLSKSKSRALSYVYAIGMWQVVFLLLVRIFANAVQLTIDLDKILSLLLIGALGLLLVFVLDRPPPVGTRWVIFLMAWGATTGLISVNRFGLQLGAAVSGVARLLIIWLIYFHCSQISGTRTGEKLNRFFYSSNLVVSSSMIMLGFVTGGYREILGELRYEYPFSNPNVLAAYAFVMCFYTLFFFHARLASLSFKKIWPVLLVLAFYLLVIIKAGSSTMLGAFCIFMLLIMVRLLGQGSYKLKFRAAVVFGFFIAIALLIAWLNFDILYSRIVLKQFDEGGGLNSGSSILWRLLAWKEYLNLLFHYNNYIIGFGAGMHRAALSDFSPFRSITDFEAPATHNDYIAILFDYGIVGMILVARLVNVLRLRIRFLAPTQGLVFGCFLCGFLVAMAFDNYIDTFLAFILAFIIGSAQKVPRSARCLN